VASNASAAPPCSNKDFNGVYTTVAQGNLFFLPPVFTPLLGPVIKVARTIADGNGNVSEVADASYNGFAFREAPYSGKYSVQPDCTIVFNWLNLLPIVVNGAIVQFSPPIPLQFVGALAQDGSDVSVEIASVASGPPGSVIRVHMQRQISDRGADNDQNVACSDQTLRGGYQLDMHGEVTDTSRYPWPPLPTFSFSREGTLSFDGNGAFTGNTTANYGGLSVVQEPLQGTYSVDNSCNVTMLYTSGASYAWQGVTTGGGDGANLMVISPGGAVIAGTLLRQRGSQ
jgi:hypothetical protein